MDSYLFGLVGLGLLGILSCSPPRGPDDVLVSADPPGENQQHNICSPPNHPAFRKYGVYRKAATGLWYTHTIDKNEAPVAYRSNYTCMCILWNPIIPEQCMGYVPSARPVHANDYPGCQNGGTCRYYMGTDANHSGYILVGPGDGI